jgi:PAS domain S-box-containing protein
VSVTSFYHIPLVFFSLIIAAVASYTFLNLAAHLQTRTGYMRTILLLGGASTSGIGIWSMHFIAMLAFHLPIPIQCNFSLLLTSMIVPIISSFIVLLTLSQKKLSFRSICLASIFMGTGISSMHYIGMASLEIAAKIHYSLYSIPLSTLIAIFHSFIAFFIFFRFKEDFQRFTIWKMISALFIGIAVCGMHYFAMAGTTFTLAHPVHSTSSSFSINHLLLAVMISVTVFIILFCTATTLFIDRLLKETEKHHQSLFTQTPEMVFLLNTDGTFVSGNPVFEKITGYAPEDYIGKHFQLVIDPKDCEKTIMFFHQALEGKVNEFDIKTKRKNGGTIDIHTKFIPMTGESGLKGVYAISQNITELKQSRKELEALHHKHTLILNSMSEGVYGIDRHINVVFCNPAAEKMTGYKAEEIIGKCLHRMIHHTKLDETPHHPEECPIYRSVQEGRTYHITKDLFFKKDGTPFLVSYTSTPILENGDVVGAVITFTDITEKEKTEELIRTSEKLSVAGQLAAGIAHEIRNPLTAIKGFLKLLESELGEKKHYLQIVQSEIQRIELILSELLVLAKPQATKFVPKEMGLLLTHVTALLETHGNLHNIQIITEIEPDLPLVECDENGLKQVFINFLKNAMEAMPNGGEIRIEAKKNGHDSIVIRFIDQGCGIPEEQLKKIGQPFFTTKEKGTGLGFMVSKKIIEDHGGTIHITSRVNEGTTIEVTLPIHIQTTPLPPKHVSTL